LYHNPFFVPEMVIDRACITGLAHESVCPDRTRFTLHRHVGQVLAAGQPFWTSGVNWDDHNPTLTGLPSETHLSGHGPFRYFEKVIKDAKHNARGELSISKGHWTRQGAAAHNVTDITCQVPIDRAYLVPRVHCAMLTTEQFICEYEIPRKPVIIEGLLGDWPAHQKWKPEALLQRLSDTHFKVGTDDEGYPVRMKLKHYLLYITDETHSQDDSPLYIFDGTFSDRKCAPELKQVRLALLHHQP
jgi:hypothetical protein